MAMTILTALGALVVAMIAGTVVAPTQETAEQAVCRAEWPGGTIAQTRSCGAGS